MPRGDVAGVDRISRWTPLGHAFRENPDRESVVRLLVLWGCAVRADDFPSHTWKGGDLEGSRRRCLLWALDLLVARHTFLTIVLGCGVHASREIPLKDRSHFARLRGDINIVPRMSIASALGVPTLAEVERLKSAVEVWRGFY